jgi:membrane protease YdiL (CAAX protease family)
VNDSISATSPAWPTRWPKNSFTGFWTWLIAGSITLLFVAAFLFELKNPPPSNIAPSELDAVLALQAVIDLCLVVLVLATLPSLSRLSLRELGFRVPTMATIGTAIVGAAAMIIVANGSAMFIDYLAHAQHQQDIVAIFKELHDTTTIAVFAGFAIIFAPFAEETLFRIFFFNLGLRYGGFWGGAVLSGVLFGLAHGSIYALLPLALGGIILCAVYYQTKNAYASMISHALFNAFSIVALLVAPKVT